MEENTSTATGSTVQPPKPAYPSNADDATEESKTGTASVVLRLTEHVIKF